MQSIGSHPEHHVTTENILCCFAVCLGQEGLAGSSIQTHLSGIRQIQISAGFPDPWINQMPRLRQVLEDIRIQAVKNERSPRPCLPITPSILYKLCKVWLEDNSSFNNIMLWAAATATFFGFCRSGVITKIHLSLADLAVDKVLAPSVISIQLKRSKTDQVMKGVKLVIGKPTMTCVRSQLCYHTWLVMAILPVHSSNGITTLLCQSLSL